MNGVEALSWLKSVPMKLKLLSCCFLLFILSCQSFPDDISSELNQTTTASFAGNLTASEKTNESSFVPAIVTPPATVVPRASEILGKKQVPILCYHQIRDWKPTDSKVSRTYRSPCRICCSNAYAGR
jgi:hypothetical protein